MDDAGTLAAEPSVGPLERDHDLALAAATDPNAFAILYARHRLAVFRYLRTRTTTEDDAAELTAITFERALSGMPRYRPLGGGFLAWLLRIARNAAIDAGRRPRVVPLAHVTVEIRAPTATEDAVLKREARAQLAEAVNRLPEPQREAIALRYAARLTAREIAVVLGKSDQATQKLLSRAIASLRETYRDDS
jgi:RNA polymerase sigma-70 factor, ECF subfamily